ncbi:hypothetical protein ACWCQK_29465 [Streptomyces sp. NPDC002306]
MSSSSPQPHGAHGADAAHDPAPAPGARPDPESPAHPNVYRPRTPAAPAYEEYADPAAAHGWTNSYDETRELPVVVDAGRPGADGSERPGEPGQPGEPPGPGRRALRGRRREARRRRAAVAVGALGVVSAAAVLAGLTFSGSPPGGARDERDRTAGESAAPADTAAAADAERVTATVPVTPSVTPGLLTAPAPSASGGSSAPATPSATGSSGAPSSPDAPVRPSATRSTAPATSAAATPTPSASASGGYGGWGHGHGHGHGHGG